VACEKALYNLRQIRTATGKDRDRVARAILTLTSSSTTDPHLTALLQTDFQGTVHLTVERAVFLQFLKNTVSKNSAQEGGIYLVDPLGNILLFYSQAAKPMDIFNDLTHVLKLSNIG
jgi:hypothetical protein